METTLRASVSAASIAQDFTLTSARPSPALRTKSLSLFCSKLKDALRSAKYFQSCSVMGPPLRMPAACVSLRVQKRTVGWCTFSGVAFQRIKLNYQLLVISNQGAGPVGVWLALPP